MKIIKIEEQTNLCSLGLTVNGGVKIVKQEWFQNEDVNFAFIIESPTVYDTYLTQSQYVKLSQKLISNNQTFSSRYVPMGYFKGQKESMWELKIDLGYIKKTPTIKVKNFGCSYGDLIIDDIEVELSHCGGSHGDSTALM